MKKLLLILGFLAVCIAIGFVILIFALGAVVRKGVNDIGPRITGTDVTLEDATLSPLTGKGTLQGLVVGNPEGWSADNAFMLERIDLHVVPITVLENPIVIEELVINRPRFVYEQRLTGGSNIRDLLNNIQQSIGGPEERPIGEPEEPPRKFIIRRLRLQEGVVRAGIGPAATDVPLPELAYDDLGVEEGGLTGAQIANRVLTDVLGRVVSAATSSGLLRLPEGSTGETLQSLGQGLKQIFGGQKEKAKDQADQQ